MVFSKVADIVSAAANRLSVPKFSGNSYTSAGLPPRSGPAQGFNFARNGRKNTLRLSSSLQDFTAYGQLDPEGGDSIFEFNKNSANLKQADPLLRENGGSSFSKEKASPKTVSNRKKWKRVILVLLCLVLFTLLVYVAQYLYFSWSQWHSKYFVVLDCGSTGTRVYVYQSSLNRDNDGSLPILLKPLPEGFQKKVKLQSGRAYNRMETEPGFDKLVNNVSGLKKAINPLVRWAEKQIPKRAHKTTSLLLYATAGLRRLPNKDSEWLLANAWSILKRSSFLCKKEWVKIISGREEAYYGWIALNYHTGVLGAIPKKDTFGSLDLGGSSLQVTFESKEDIQDDTSLKLSIGTVNHHLTAYSLAGYGLNDAFDKSVAHLLRQLPRLNNKDIATGKVEIKHPCLQSGYKEQFSCSNCASVYQEDGASPTGEISRQRIALKLVGDPKWEECSAVAKIAVNLSEWSNQSPVFDCELQPCALSDNLPRPYGQFYAMSGFYVVYRFFNLTSDASLDDVLEKGKEFCEKSWNVAKKSVAPQPFIEQYCFRAPYIVSLLREGLHITDRHVTVGSGSITWTLGVALVEAGKVYSNRSRLHSYQMLFMKINPIILFSILFVSLLLLLWALTCFGNWTPKVFQRAYLPLFRHNSTPATSVLWFKRWSPIMPGDGRVKMPLSPTVGGTQHQPLDAANNFSSSGVQLTDFSSYPAASSVAHSYSSGSLGQMQFDANTMGSFWTPHRSQMRLQSRRSQSREDLNASAAEAHLVKT